MAVNPPQQPPADDNSRLGIWVSWDRLSPTGSSCSISRARTVEQDGQRFCEYTVRIPLTGSGLEPEKSKVVDLLRGTIYFSDGPA